MMRARLGSLLLVLPLATCRAPGATPSKLEAPSNQPEASAPATSPPPTETDDDADAKVRREPEPTATYAFRVAGLPTIGAPTAKVTLVKAYEYMCPYSHKVNDTLDELRARYGKDLRIAYSQRVVHPPSATAPAMAACAAHKQRAFTAMDRELWKLFSNRTLDESVAVAGVAAAGGSGSGAARATKVSCHTTPGGCPKLAALAASLGLDEARFAQDFRDCEAEVQAQQAHSSQLGAAGTPAFFVNGRFLNGAQPLERFVAIIDEELQKADERIAQGTAAADYYDTWVLGAGEAMAPPRATP